MQHEYRVEDMHNGINAPLDSTVPVTRLWALRMLEKLGLREYCTHYLLSHTNELVVLLGLNMPGNDLGMSQEELMDFISKRHAEYERMQPMIQGELRCNLDRLGQLMGLDRVDKDILGFVTVLFSNSAFITMSESLGSLNSAGMERALSIILAQPLSAIHKALSRESTLSRSGILRIDRKSATHLANKLELMVGLDGLLLEAHPDIDRMMQAFFRAAKPATLTPSDFRHLEEDYRMLHRYLKKAVVRQQAGVNVLLHGRPGVGKTEWVRVLCESLKFKLYEISVVDDEGDALPGKHRFGAYRLTQQILSHQKGAVVLFDEIEDVFPTRDFLSDNREVGKGWVNELLENNPVPSIWISNAIDHIDPAYLRRFDCIMEMDTPPRSVRRSILANRLAHLGVSDDWLDRMADVPDMAPALVSRAARVVDAIRDRRRSAHKVEKQMERILGNMRQAMGLQPIAPAEQKTRLSYCLDVLNTDHKLSILLKGLKRTPEARLCFYGPPGTGKTAFARHMAQQLERPLLIRRASDLLGSYVGMTEAAIARMFEAAEQEGAILLLDEADSFLRDRRSAHHSWEVTLVNEMLTRMEAFSGIFVVSTNLMNLMDSAAMRRFDFKVHFDWLQPPQAWALFCQLVGPDAWRIEGAEEYWRSRLEQLHTLTPGDFANLERQLRVTGEAPQPDTLFRLLERETRSREGGTETGVGFLARL